MEDSPPVRSTILGSFLRGRPRNSSQSEPRDFSSFPSPPSPSTASVAVVASLAGGTGTLITNAPARLPRQSNSNPTSPNPNSPAISLSIPPSSTSANITPTPSSPSAPSTFASMLRRKPNPNPTNAAQQPAAPSLSPVLPSSAPHTPLQAPSIPSAAQSAPNTALIPTTTTTSSMPGGLIPGSSIAQPLVSTTAATPANSSFRIRLVPHLDSRRSLRFDAITRDLRDADPALRIGRFTDRSGMGLSAVNALGTNKLAFKSKVVSRAHAEIWVEKGGKFFIKDTKSSSGTFLNHVRLSPANQESRPFQLKDGDILQLGVDYQGGAEDIYKSVKIRVEVGREWQASANAFNTAALKNLKNLAAVVAPAPTLPRPAAHSKPTTHKPNKLQIPDCCICLFAVSIRQALFIAPCSHTFHFKCIRPLIESHHPAFSCPLCRTYADLEEDVEVEPADADLDADQADPDADADADVEIDEGPSSSSHTHKEAEGAASAHREDAEMSDGSISNVGPPPPARPAHAPVAPTIMIGTIPISGRLVPITEHELRPSVVAMDRDREAGGETEVEPDSVGQQLSLSSRRAAARGGAGASRARYVSAASAVAAGACTEDEGMSGIGGTGGVEEVDEIEMEDAIEYDGPEEDSAMDEEHDFVDVAPAVVPVDGIAELGAVGGSSVPGGSIGGKRKR